MDPSHLHQLLQRQIAEAAGDSSGVPPNLHDLMQRISDTYTAYAEEYKKVEAQVALRTEQLMASTSRAYSFLDSLNMGFIMCDVNGETVLSNNVVRKTLSSKIASSSEMAANQPAEMSWTIDAIDALFQPDLPLKNLVLECLQSSQTIERKEVNFGDRVLHLYLAPMINEVAPGDKQQIGAVILIEDITEQKDLERSKDEFLSIASHELRTPLTAIRGNSALLTKYYGDKITDKDMAEMISDIHESSVRLIEIVNDFLDVSALEQGKMRMNPETITLGEITTDVVRELQNLCDSKGIRLIGDPSVAAAPPVVGDQQRTKQVIYNLVGNASKFTENGTITISARTDDNFVYIAVTDTGRGMSPENQRLLFKKFQQASNSLLTRDTTKGTGLGLYISKLIIELSGGSIKLERSEVGKGSTFVFSLPRAKS